MVIMMWHEGPRGSLEAMPSGAAALGPPLSPEPLHEVEAAAALWGDGIAAMQRAMEAMPSGAAALGPPPLSPEPLHKIDAAAAVWGDSIPAMQRTTEAMPISRNGSSLEMQATFDADAYAYAFAAAAAAKLRSGRPHVPSLAIPHAAGPSREPMEWHSRVSFESDSEEVLCGVPGLALPADSLGLGSLGIGSSQHETGGLWAAMTRWATPFLGKLESVQRPAGPIVGACCARTSGEGCSRTLSADFSQPSDGEAVEPERQAACLVPRPQVPTEPMAAIGPLGVPVAACRQRQAPLSAIYELPAQYSSATFDELGSALLESSGLSMGSVRVTPEVDLPDPAMLGLVAAEDLSRPLCGNRHGLGRVRRGHLGPVGRVPAVLVTELLLPRPLDSSQRKRLHSALRASLVSRSDLSAPLGAVPAPLECGGAGIWAVWSDPVGAAVAWHPAWLPSWSPPSLPEPSVSGARPLHEALRAELPLSSFRTPAWRLAVARQIAAAVAGLHRARRSHGSLSPSCIWVSPGGSLGIMEAGIVDVLLECGVLHEHELLACLGLTFARYLAPEGWQMPRRVGPEAAAAADVWSMGLLILEVLGCAPSPHSECRTLQQLSAKVLPQRGQHTAPRVRPSGDYGRLPESSRRCLEACLSASPSSRPRAEEVLFSLAAPADDGIDCVHKPVEVSSPASRTPSTSTAGEGSTCSSSSSSTTAPQQRRELQSGESHLEEELIAGSSLFQSDAPLPGSDLSCSTLSSQNECRADDNAHARAEHHLGTHMSSMLENNSTEVLDSSPCSRSESFGKCEFYSGVEPVGSPRTRTSHRSELQEELSARLSCSQIAAGIADTQLTSNTENSSKMSGLTLHSGHSALEGCRHLQPPRERPPPPPEPTLEEIRSGHGLPCAAELRCGALKGEEPTSDQIAHAHRHLHDSRREPQHSRPPRERPYPPPAPTMEEVLLAVSTPLRCRARAGLEHGESSTATEAPPPPAPAPPLVW